MVIRYAQSAYDVLVNSKTFRFRFVNTKHERCLFGIIAGNALKETDITIMNGNKRIITLHVNAGPPSELLTFPYPHAFLANDVVRAESDSAIGILKLLFVSDDRWGLPPNSVVYDEAETPVVPTRTAGMKEAEEFTVKMLAEQHAEWFSDVMKEIVKRVYRDAFIHGYKHGKEEQR